MKILISILAFVIGCAAAAQDQPAARTNLIMKGIYGTRTKAGVPVRGTEAAVMDGLRALKASQNEDGSWGTGERRCLATALVLAALVGHGEVESSQEFGAALGKAHEWLMASAPSNNAERIAVVAALSGYDAAHFGGHPRELARREVAKVKEAMAGVVLRPDDPWTDYLALHLTPPEVERPAEIRRNRDYLRGWKDRSIDLEPHSVTGCVALCAASLGKFNHGGQPWTAFNKEFAPIAVWRQTKAGFWPCLDENDRFACTALTIESMKVYYAFRKWYWPEPKPEPEKEEHQEIKVDAR